MKYKLLAWMAPWMATPFMAKASLWNMTPGVTEISQQVYSLHMTIFYICCAIAFVVFGVMIISLIRHRKSKGATPAHFHESTKVEIAWTVVPFLILIGMAVPATSTLIAMEDPSDADLTIQITGSQWKWHYQYFGEDVGFYSLLSTPKAQIENQAAKGENYLLEVDKPLVLPTNRKVRFLLTSDDVIHSWWVPAFAVKKDANPGFINEAWTRVTEPGIYRGQCAELCGKDHGYMPVVVEVLPEAEFDLWLEQQKRLAADAEAAERDSLSEQLGLSESMTLGEQVYNGRCAACHQPNGMGLPGVFPAIKGSPVALGDVAAHIDIVAHGQTGTAMQAFADQLSLKELAAVVTYQRNAFGNDTGDVIQTREVNDRLNGGEPDEAGTGAKHTEPNEVVEPTSAIEASTETTAALTLEQAMTLGSEIYNGRCAACHQVNGMGVPGAFPAINGSAIALGEPAEHISIVAEGRAGTAMMGFAGQLSARELAAVVTYQRNAWDNQTGDLIQATDVDAVAGQ
ncbi:cytochrome c oxidase subunit II [Ferrimonas gelatinilytica]|uniref:Cytochrome c oxidase subunit 2 n=1 Tax=Ferrimonas gelatinilytica TaxID=1255257 RepID=A0ABP9SB89_9GAMM